MGFFFLQCIRCDIEFWMASSWPGNNKRSIEKQISSRGHSNSIQFRGFGSSIGELSWHLNAAGLEEQATHFLASRRLKLLHLEIWRTGLTWVRKIAAMAAGYAGLVAAGPCLGCHQFAANPSLSWVRFTIQTRNYAPLLQVKFGWWNTFMQWVRLPSLNIVGPVLLECRQLI